MEQAGGTGELVNAPGLGKEAVGEGHHALEKEMATHSSVLAWRIPGMAEPGGLPSHRSPLSPCHSAASFLPRPGSLGEA